MRGNIQNIIVKLTFNSIKDYPIISPSSDDMSAQFFQFHQGLSRGRSYFCSIELDSFNSIKDYLTVGTATIIFHKFLPFNSIKDYPKVVKVSQVAKKTNFQFHQGLSGEDSTCNDNDWWKSFNSIKDYLSVEDLLNVYC